MTYLAQIEALLFVAGEEGLKIRDLASLLDLTPSALQQQLEKLSDKYQNDSSSALFLVETASTYKIVTKDSFAPLLKEFAKAPINQTLSRASLEVLSIIAYKQPITRVEVDDIRGVNSSGAISKLLAFELIKENGKKEVPGRPNLYITTDYFLDYMGINQLDQLVDASSIELVDEETSLFAEESSDMKTTVEKETYEN
ncbi:segregation and condensation protein B [Streptococcus urinalis FB127-CNA-2]|uniref:Segregation and condensation protein B n=1 Tax=Streptococcus urinalis 2285-97 TaxID=764291 RepID=G5KI50_9STRE|nr:SMC-Scp complex subunit ScpB [Streptococcus urinalis]EHJ57154.1 segregation and condensation protein B [Streptococcus urinalis 2285-97]EKS20538.1 segregation and condensation protein B [Streptococcus urinalis FB127-CNA-2]VEF31231.1 Segregation and condensation protein B [Streptococcus urinalis]